MQKIITLLSFIFASISICYATSVSDLDEAKKKAILSDKYILVEFSGSDWCPPCIRLNNEVFSKSEWKSWAADNVISVLIDFPNSGQSKEVRKKNEIIAKKLKVNGFPTILILDKHGDEQFRTGYVSGGAEVYINHLLLLAKKNVISF